MIVHNINKMIKGWFIGNFEPSVIKTELFEVGILKRYKGLERPMHYHKISKEITCLISGKATINNVEISPGDIFILEKNEVVDALYHEDSILVVIKMPSVTGDKYEI
jgi:dTDP-4-dehydrorhamnose 3,5-epimerase-like enzyme